MKSKQVNHRIKIIAGIGSRETPQNILNEMVKIGEYCRESKIVVRSGHAEGADFAFEWGAQEMCNAFIPWKGFNSFLQSNAVLMVPTMTEQLMKTVYDYHPNPHRLTIPVQKIMARNACQVLGPKLDKPVKFVVCWTRDGKASGGTGQAIRVAEAHKVPVYNMYCEEYATAESIIKKLES